MCGIVGFIKSTNSTTRTLDLEKVFTQGLYADALRGWDSTGIALVSSKLAIDPVVYKRALPAADFICTKRAHKLLNNLTNIEAAIGHNRAATRGTVSDDNAHPFQEGPITMVHNGTLSEYRSLIKGQIPTGLTVDSHFVTHALATAKNPVEVLEQLKGDYALVWYDTRTEKYYVARNAGRPLGFVYTPKRKDIFFASEAYMMYWLAKRNNVTVAPEIMEFKINTLYEIDPANLENFRTTEFTPAPRPQYWGGYGNSRWSHHNHNNYGQPKTSTKAATDLEEERIKRITKELKFFGLTYQQEMPFMPIQFNPFPKNPQMGTVEGFVEYIDDTLPKEDEYQVMEAIMYGVSREQALRWIRSTEEKGEYISAPVIAVQDRKSGESVLVLNPSLVRIGATPPWKEEDEKKKKDKESFSKGAKVKLPPIVREDQEKKNTPAVFLPKPKGKPRIKLPKDHKGPINRDNFVCGPNELYISLSEFKDLTKKGCACCGGYVNPRFAEKVAWVGKFQDVPVCHECASKEETLAALGMARGE